MKRFLKKSWHRVPVGIITAVLVLGLVAGGVFAAYSFLSLTTEIYVDEPLTIEYNLQGQYSGDSNWHLLGDDDSLTLERSAGDNFAMDLRVTNDADNALTVNTVVSGQAYWFTFGGWPDGTVDNCPNGQTTFAVTLNVSGDAPAPATYNVTLAFTRE